MTPFFHLDSKKFVSLNKYYQGTNEGIESGVFIIPSIVHIFLVGKIRVK